MTNFGKGKILITTLISVLLCVLTAFSVLGVNLKLKNNQEKETTQTQAATTNLDSEIWGVYNPFDTPGGPDYATTGNSDYNLDSYDENSTDEQIKEIYYNHDYFHIYSYWGLWKLSKIMDHGFSFKDKYIYLWSDIVTSLNTILVPLGSYDSTDQLLLPADKIIVAGYGRFEGTFYGNGYSIDGFKSRFDGCLVDTEPNYGIFASFKYANIP